MKRFLFRTLVILLGILGSFGVSNAQVSMWENDKFFYMDTPVAWDVNAISQSEDLGALVAAGIATSEKTLLNSFLKMFGFGGAEYAGVPKALIYAKFIINLLLWLVSFLALVIIIYSFYIMFFTEDSKGVEKVKKSLTGVAIALIILGLSRVIISFIFDFYQKKLLNPETAFDIPQTQSLSLV